jgi:Cu2+-exporting ATPase
MEKSPTHRLAGHKMSDIQATHDRHAGHSVAMFRDKFWLSFALTIPVVFWSADVQHWLGYTAPTFPRSKFIPPVLGTVVFVYGGLVFIRAARGELADHKPGMMTLISLGIIAAFGTSLAATFGQFQIDVWWELTSPPASCCKHRKNAEPSLRFVCDFSIEIPRKRREISKRAVRVR